MNPSVLQCITCVFLMASMVQVTVNKNNCTSNLPGTKEQKLQHVFLWHVNAQRPHSLVTPAGSLRHKHLIQFTTSVNHKQPCREAMRPDSWLGWWWSAESFSGDQEKICFWRCGCHMPVPVCCLQHAETAESWDSWMGGWVEWVGGAYYINCSKWFGNFAPLTICWSECCFRSCSSYR